MQRGRSEVFLAVTANSACLAQMLLRDEELYTLTHISQAGFLSLISHVALFKMPHRRFLECYLRRSIGKCAAAEMQQIKLCQVFLHCASLAAWEGTVQRPQRFCSRPKNKCSEFCHPLPPLYHGCYIAVLQMFKWRSL